MEFRIADTFTDSLARLTGDEQKAVKTTAFDLQLNPAAPGLSFHKLDRAKDKNFWSVRVNADIRLIVHRTADSLLLCYVNHHDKAYDWAMRRKLETHPKTGAAQLVEIRETVQEVLIPAYVPAPSASPRQQVKGPSLAVLAHVPEGELLAYGVPAEWVNDVRSAIGEDGLLAVTDHLPAEAAEAVLELAVGNTPRKPQPAAPHADPFAHPDAQRRFRVLGNVAELERALEFPWDKWMIFLHPEQQDLVERDYAGPARVTGSAGTGKTIVALHRAVHLVRANPEARVLLATFSTSLANALAGRVRRLIRSEPTLGDRLEVHTLETIAERLFARHLAGRQLATAQQLRAMVDEAARTAGILLSPNYVFAEWMEVVDAWQLHTWEAYRDFKRLGRKTRLAETQRALLWGAFEAVQTKLTSQRLVTRATMYRELAVHIAGQKHPPFEHVIVDEAQDVSVPQLRLLSALGAARRNGLFFAGDGAQRIFQQPFSWLATGVDIRGRSRNLNVNYRMSHQIRSQADRLLGREVSDVDGNIETRAGTISVFNGPLPEIFLASDASAELEHAAQWVKARVQEGVAPHEIGVFVRSPGELARGRAALERAGVHFAMLDERAEVATGRAVVGVMHLAKGLEFRAVAVLGCDEDIIPSETRISVAADESELEEIYNTERHLLYVACTRARDHLLVSAVAPGSEFLADLK